MAPTDDDNATGPATPASTEEPGRARGRVRARPEARVRAPRSRPSATDATAGEASKPRAGEARRPRAREAVASADATQKRKIVILSVITVVVLSIAVGAFVIGQGADTNPRAATPNASATTVPEGDPATAPGPTLPDSAFTEFRDDETGFRMKYPSDWTKLTAPDRALRLVATPNGQDRVSVRVTTTDQPTTPDNIKNMKTLTDGGIGQNPTVKVLDQRALTVNGLIGYYYLYTYTDEKSGLQAAHAHYFLFQGRKMNMIVFQALPAERFQDLKGVFDQMLDSFHSDPEPPGATGPAPETTAPPVSAPAPPS